MQISRLNLKSRKLAAAGLGCLVLATAAGCKSAVVSADGNSVTLAPGPDSSSAASTPAARPSVTTQPPAPAPTVTVTATPAALPAPTVTVTETVTVATCLPPAVTEGWLYQLATSQQATAALAQCLNVPPPNQPEFETQLALYAMTAYQAGEFQTSTGREAWTVTARWVQCPDGHEVYSLPQIYSRYSVGQ